MNGSIVVGRQDGFTFVEVIVVLMLVGILAATAGMGISLFMKGYVTARENVSIAQKASLAMERMTRELESLTEIDATSNGTCIRYRIATESSDYRRIQYAGNQIQLDLASTVDCDRAESGKTLTDRVAAGTFSLRYETESGLASSPPSNLRDLRAIRIGFDLERTDNVADMDFSLTVNPRNSGAMKGPGIEP